MIDVDRIPNFPALDGKKFLLGIGAMKCATSWMYHYLRALPGVATSPIKELNFFNEAFPDPQGRSVIPKIIKRVQDYCELSGDTNAQLKANPHFQASVDRLKMIYDPSEYFNHFARLATKETEVFCEITPRYATLRPEGFGLVKDFFKTQNLDLKVFFVMRDPVERLWSQLRYAQQFGEAKDIEKTWSSMLKKRAVLEYADYQKTIELLETVFPRDAVAYLFYEDLFEGDALRKLCEFAELPFHPPEKDERHNETRVKVDMPTDVRSALQYLLAPQYEYCGKRFANDLPNSWAALSQV